MVSVRVTGGLNSRNCAVVSYDDEDLVALVRESGPSSSGALEALLRRYKTAIYRACLSYLREADKAEEASQEILLHVYRGIDRFHGRSSFRTWLYRIIQNDCCTVYSHHARHQVCERFDEDERYIHPLTTDDFVSTLELTNIIDAVLDRLPSTDREVIKLRFFHNLSLMSIADHLGTSLSGVKMRLYRAIGRFKKTYVSLEADLAVL